MILLNVFPLFYKSVFLNRKIFVYVNPCVLSCILNQVLRFNKFIQINRKPDFYKKFYFNNINFLVQLVDRNSVFKDWNTLRHEYNLQNNLYFQWMQLISAILSTWKNIIKQNNDINMFMTTQHHFIQKSRVLTVQKVTSKELYWILIITTEHEPTSQNTLKKKFTELSFDWKEIYMTLLPAILI